MTTKLFIFDWDGTLCDSTDHIIHTMQRAIEALRLPSLSDAAVRNIIGLGLPEALRALYPDQSGEQLEALRQHYARLYIEADHRQVSTLFPGALETLAELRERGHQLAIATGKSRRGLDRVLGQLELADAFDATRCADETRSKPHPLMLEELLEELGFTAADAAMVGDTEYDLAMAAAIDVAPVAVTWGAHSVERLRRHQPQQIIDRLPQLLDWSLAAPAAGAAADSPA